MSKDFTRLSGDKMRDLDSLPDALADGPGKDQAIARLLNALIDSALIEDRDNVMQFRVNPEMQHKLDRCKEICGLSRNGEVLNDAMTLFGNLILQIADKGYKLVLISEERQEMGVIDFEPLRKAREYYERNLPAADDTSADQT